MAARKLRPRPVYQAVCDVVVRHGGVMLAFAAEPDADRKRRLVPVCWAGEQADYIDDLVLPLDGDPAQWAQLAQAFHSTTPQYCDDGGRPRHGAMARQGHGRRLQSLACLPLKVGGTVRAVCNLYTDKQAVFDEQVQQLVLRLADTGWAWLWKRVKPPWPRPEPKLVWRRAKPGFHKCS